MGEAGPKSPYDL